MKEATWEKLGKTDPKYTKPISGKNFNGTAINPTYCYRKMTEVFGPVGIGWKFETTKSETVKTDDGQILLYKEIRLYIREGQEWSAPIEGCGGEFIIKKNKNGLVADDEAHKKVTTDALTNAMKFLGMSADIHMGMYDDNKYINQITEEFKKDEPKEFSRENKIFQRDFAYELSTCETIQDVDSLIDKYGEELAEKPDAITGILTDQIDVRKEGIKNKVSFTPSIFKFIDVPEAKEFMALAGKKLETLEGDALTEWANENKHRIDAMDATLNAAIYNKDGKPSERFRKAYNTRLQIAAE